VDPPSQQAAALPPAPEQVPPDVDSPLQQAAASPAPEQLPADVDPLSPEAATPPAVEVPRQGPFCSWAYDEWGYDELNMESLFIALTDRTCPLPHHVDLDNHAQDNGDEGRTPQGLCVGRHSRSTPQGLCVGRRSDQDTADSSLTESL